MAKQEKSYLIKIPVYSSELITRANDIFGGISYSHMIDYAIKKLDSYIQKPFKISKDKRNKAQTREIDKIGYSKYQIGKVPVLLIQVSAYNTNLHDGYVELKERIPFEQNNKVGSDNNFFLLYPHIFGIDANNYKHQWLVLIYEDPNKDANELISAVKLVLQKILDTRIANIKLSEIISDLRKLKSFPDLQVKLSSITYDDNDVDLKYRSYLVTSKVVELKEDNFKNLPVDETYDILNDLSYSTYQKKEIRINQERKEYRILREMKNDAQHKIMETIEEIFNFPITISERELINIFDQKVIISNFTTVLNSYLSSANEY